MKSMSNWLKILITYVSLILCSIACSIILYFGVMHTVFAKVSADLEHTIESLEGKAFDSTPGNALAQAIQDYFAEKARLEEERLAEEARLAAEAEAARQAALNPEVSRTNSNMPSENSAFGTISIERLGMNVPLYHGDTSAILRKGAGEYIGPSGATFGEGRQILVCAHNTSYFKPLQNAQVGDIVKVSTTYGEFGYEIVRIQVYDMNDPNCYDFNLDHEQLAMYTCYPFSGPPGKTQRYFCYCDKIYGPTLVD